jgi:opacity protein-like surface antigen
MLAGGLVMAGVAVAAPHAWAQPWNGSATIYGWVPAIQGSQEGRDGEPIIDITGPNVLEALQFAFMAAGEVRRDKLGFMFDAVYADMKFDAEAERVDISAELTTKLYFASGAVSWRLYDEAGVLVDAYGGLRAYGIETDFGLQIGQLAGERDATVNWVDPIVGFRGAYPLGDRFSVSGRADIGGFGVGSELTWQAYGGVNWLFADSWAATLGYRYMSIDYEADRLTLDIALQGPLIGVTYEF